LKDTLDLAVAEALHSFGLQGMTHA